MSACLMGRVVWADLPAHLKFTALIIANYANDEGYAYPGRERIAEHMRQSVRQVARNIRELEELGVLSRSHRGKHGGGRGSNSYQFNLDSLPHPGHEANRTSASCSNVTSVSSLNRTPMSPLNGTPVSSLGEQTGHPCPSNGTPTSPYTSEEPSEKKEDTSKPASRIPTCPHLEIIGIYHRVLHELPRVVESRWKGSASERNLKARWAEDERHQSLKFWEQLFGVVRTNDWWMGRGDWKGANLHWLVKRANFDKALERGINLNRETKDNAR